MCLVLCNKSCQHLVQKHRLVVGNLDQPIEKYLPAVTRDNEVSAITTSSLSQSKRFVV
jgi:hypothetical protein